jgi:hypothetical protein
MALYSHAANQGDFSASSDTSPHVLRFEVPTVEGNRADDDAMMSPAAHLARVYVRLSVSVPLVSGPKVIRIKPLPLMAPPLDINLDAAPAPNKLGDDGNAGMAGSDDGGDEN